MSQVPSGQPLGTERIDFVGNTAPIEKAAAKTVEVSKAAGAEAQAAVMGVEKAHTEQAKAATEAGDATEAAGRKAGAPWRFLITTVGGIVGGFLAISRAAQGIVAVMESGESKAARFMLALRDQGGAKALQEIEDRLTKLSEIQSGGGNVFTDFLDIVRAAAGLTAKEVEALEAQKKSAQLKANTEQTQAELDSQKKVAEQAERLRAEAFEATLDEGQKITFNEAKRIKQIEQLRKDARTDANVKALDEAERQIRESARLEMQVYEQTQAQKRIAERQAEEERRRDSEESASRQAEALAKALSRSLSSIQNQANNLFNSDKLSIQLAELAKIMERVASNTRNING